MMKKLSTLSLPLFAVFATPLQALAQTQQPTTPPPDYYGPGPWHMWDHGYGYDYG